MIMLVMASKGVIQGNGLLIPRRGLVPERGPIPARGAYLSTEHVTHSRKWPHVSLNAFPQARDSVPGHLRCIQDGLPLNASHYWGLYMLMEKIER